MTPKLTPCTSLDCFGEYGRCITSAAWQPWLLFFMRGEFGKKVKSEAERERLLSLSADLSQISGRFLTQAQFIAKPAVPNYPERPSPSLVIALGALLSALLAAAFVWRKLIIKMLSQDDANKV